LFIKLRQFDALGSFFERRYILPPGALDNTRALPFTVFRSYSEILAHQSKKAGHKRLSVEADLIKQRASLRALPFTTLMEADLLVCLRTMMRPAELAVWPPVTLVYAKYSDTFELFVRGQERRCFKRLAAAIGVADKAEMVAKLKEWSEIRADRLSWLFARSDLNIEQFMGLDKLDTIGS